MDDQLAALRSERDGLKVQLGEAASALKCLATMLTSSQAHADSLRGQLADANAQLAQQREQLRVASLVQAQLGELQAALLAHKRATREQEAGAAELRAWLAESQAEVERLEADSRQLAALRRSLAASGFAQSPRDCPGCAAARPASACAAAAKRPLLPSSPGAAAEQPGSPRQQPARSRSAVPGQSAGGGLVPQSPAASRRASTAGVLATPRRVAGSVGGCCSSCSSSIAGGGGSETLAAASLSPRCSCMGASARLTTRRLSATTPVPLPAASEQPGASGVSVSLPLTGRASLPLL